MPTQYPFGKPYPRAIDPIPSGIANGRGLYRWSAFYAPLVTLINDLIEADGSLTSEVVSLLLFTNDIPIIARAYVYDATSLQYNTTPLQNLVTLSAAFVTDASGGVAPVTITNYGEVLKGYSGDALSVSVSGFPARLASVVTAPLSSTVSNNVIQPGTATSVAIECIANGAVASGIVGHAFIGKATSFSIAAPTPVILRSSDYTQAIKDNDNLLVDANGNLGQVVGLYYVTP